MAAASNLKSRIERRLREVQREALLVREDVRALRAALERRDELDRLPRLKSSRYHSERVPAPSRADPIRKEIRTPPKVDALPGTGVPPAARAYEPMESSVASGTAKPKPVQRDERFANLFSSSGFLGTAAASPVDHRIQRNKAIFVLVFVLLALFIVINLLTY